MKVFLAFGFSCCFLLGFGQEREQLEMPAQLNPIKVEWPVVEFPKVINPNKPIEFIGLFIFCGSSKVIFIDGVKITTGLPKQEKEVEIISNGLPTRIGGGFVTLYKNQEIGWYGTSSRRRSKY